ncbi:MAG TPA: nuclear transport factor 2 family protein [Bryobacteraceae bacterium]|jgi:ketosteroid isomerase-like protein
MTSDALRTLTDYYRAFSTLKLDAIFPFFHEPATLISSQGVFVAAKPADVAAVFQQAIDGLRAAGFGHSELAVKDERSLSATASLIRGVAIRYHADGHELNRAGVTYVLNRTGDTWKIAVLILHDVVE